eukprot:14210779-Alexandrium_andersonii.AAC.1
MVVDAAAEYDVSNGSRGFTFAGGDRADAHAQVRFQTPDLAMTVSAYTVDRPSPILLGLDFLRSNGIVIDYSSNTAWSHTMQTEVPIH